MAGPGSAIAGRCQEPDAPPTSRIYSATKTSAVGTATSSLASNGLLSSHSSDRTATLLFHAGGNVAVQQKYAVVPTSELSSSLIDGNVEAEVSAGTAENIQDALESRLRGSISPAEGGEVEMV